LKRKVSVLIERLGADDAARVSAVHGGTLMHVPAETARAGRLARQFGERLAARLVMHFGGERIYVPVLNPLRWGTVDHGEVQRMTEAGQSAAGIARSLGCSKNTVRSIRRKARASDAGSGSDGGAICPKNGF